MPDLKFLISKLNAVCRVATENAAMLAVTRGNEEVDIEHLILSLIESPNSDAGRIFDYFGLDLAQVASASNTSLNKRVSGIVQAPTFASRLIQLFSSAWALASLEFQATEIRSAMLALALVQAERPEVLSQILSKEWLKLTTPKLRTCLPELLSASEGISKLQPSAEKPGTPALGQFTVDLTAAARAGMNVNGEAKLSRMQSSRAEQEILKLKVFGFARCPTAEVAGIDLLGFIRLRFGKIQ